MKIQIQRYAGANTVILDVADYVSESKTLEFTGAEGAMESLNDDIDNLSEKFGRLLDILATKGILTGPEIVEVAEDKYNAPVVAMLRNGDE